MVAKLKLTKLQKLGGESLKGRAKSNLAFPWEPRRKQKKRFKTRLLAYIRILIICFSYFNAVKSPYYLTAICEISAVAP